MFQRRSPAECTVPNQSGDDEDTSSSTYESDICSTCVELQMVDDDAASSKMPTEEDVTAEDVNSNIEQVRDDIEGNSMVDDVSLSIYSLDISREKAGNLNISLCVM